MTAPAESLRERLDAMEKRATKGPWHFNSYSRVDAAGYAKQHHALLEEWVAAGAPGDGADNIPPEWSDRFYELDYEVCHVPAHHGDTATGRHAADAEFIEALRNAWPRLSALLAAGEAAEKALDEIESELMMADNRQRSPDCADLAAKARAALSAFERARKTA